MLAYAIGKPKDVLEIERPPESPMAQAMKLLKPEEIRVLAAAAARVIGARKAIVVEAKRHLRSESLPCNP